MVASEQVLSVDEQNQVVDLVYGLAKSKPYPTRAIFDLLAYALCGVSVHNGATKGKFLEAVSKVFDEKQAEHIASIALEKARKRGGA